MFKKSASADKRKTSSMVAQAEILSSLAYFAVLYPVMIFAYRGEKVNRRKCVWTVLTIAIAALAIKLVRVNYFTSMIALLLFGESQYLFVSAGCKDKRHG